jgi:PAS domain S-box-containing protein
MKKIKHFRDWKLSSKVIAVAFVSTIFFPLMVMLYLLPLHSSKMEKEKMNAVQQVVETAYNLMVQYDSQVSKGELSLEQAQEEAKNKIRGLRYSGDNYFWINDLYPKMIMHPFKPELDGTDLSGNKDPNGKHLFAEFVKVCQEQGEGHVDYMWPKPNVDEPQPKISFVKLYKPWGWIVGSGVYVDDIQKEVADIRQKMIIILCLTFLFPTIIGYSLGRFIGNPVRKLIEAAKKFSEGKTDIAIEVKSKDEIGELANTFNQMTEKISLQLQYMDNLTNPVMITDTEFTIQYMNKKGAEVLGKTRKELVGQKCYDNFKTGHCKTDNCALYKAMKNDRVFVEETVAHPNGGEIPIIYTGTPIKDKAGKITGALELVTPIKEIKDLQNYLTRSTNKMLIAMEEFEKGDLTVEVIPEKEDDELGKLFNGFNKAVLNMKQIIEHVRESIHATASASTEISASTEEMAAGAQQQSVQSSEVAAAVEQMTKTILESSKNTGTAAENAKKAGEIAGEGGKAVENTVEGMNRIAEVVSSTSETVKQLGKSSSQIGEIIEVIDDIADQTNLLALNAAIEAARAGEQGRGFAVVADEVRKLAERTTKATKEIATMIKQIQKDTGEAVDSIEKGTTEVEKGKNLAKMSGETLEKIISASEKVVDEINQIASAGEEQSSTAEQISKSIEAMSKVTNESASGIQQVARATEDLSKLTDNLQNLISRFKIDSGKESNYFVRQNGKLIESA